MTSVYCVVDWYREHFMFFTSIVAYISNNGHADSHCMVLCWRLIVLDMEG